MSEYNLGEESKKLVDNLHKKYLLIKESQLTILSSLCMYEDIPTKELNYEIGQPVKASDYIHIKEFADLLRKTWIGLSIETLANLKNILENKKKKGDLDLTELLVS